MNEIMTPDDSTEPARQNQSILRGWPGFVLNYFVITVLTLSLFYLSLLSTSLPLLPEHRASLDQAIEKLEKKGFTREVFFLRNIATFRESDNWVNSLNENESAYAATNFPFGIITLYSDFFEKATDDTERAAILLHETQHLIGRSERQAYEFAWRARHQLGWSQMRYGTTESFVTIQLQTKEFAPELFSCKSHLWSDCTEDKKPAEKIAKK